MPKKCLKSTQGKNFESFKGFKKVIEFANAKKEDRWAHDEKGWVHVPGVESPPTIHLGVTFMGHSRSP